MSASALKGQGRESAIKHAKRLVKFGGVGIVNTVVDFMVFAFFVSILRAPAWVAQAFGYAAGMTNSFLMNRGFTYHSSDSSGGQVLRFLFANLISFLLSVLIMKTMMQRFDASSYFTKILILFVTQGSNYLLYSYWVFRKQNDE